MDKYDDLKKLEELRLDGAISEAEYQREKFKILNSDNKSGPGDMNENTYIVLMHLSQFAGFLIPGLGFILPIVMWLVNAKDYPNIDRHGKNIANFMISMFIYMVVAGIFCLTIIGLVIGIPMFIAIGILELVFIIIATVKANSGQYWKYPLSITFFS